MKKIFFLSFYFFFCCHSNFAFTLNNNLNLSFDEDEVPVYVARGLCDNIGITEEELVSIVSEANSKYWNTVSTSRLKLTNGGLLSVSADFGSEALCTGSGSSCTVNPLLVFSRGILIACNEDTTSNFPNSGLLAVTVPTSTSGKSIKGSVLLLNDTASNAIEDKSRDEITALIAHELGHAVGLGHSPVRDSLMYYLSIPTRRNLGWDDIDGLTYLYPKKPEVGCGTVAHLNQNDKTQNPYLAGILGFMLTLFLIKTIKGGQKDSKVS